MITKGFVKSCKQPLVGAWGFAGVVVVKHTLSPEGRSPVKGEMCVCVIYIQLLIYVSILYEKIYITKNSDSS